MEQFEEEHVRVSVLSGIKGLAGPQDVFWGEGTGDKGRQWRKLDWGGLGMPGAKFGLDPNMAGVIVCKNYSGAVHPQLLVCRLSFFLRRPSSGVVSAEHLIALGLQVWTPFWVESVSGRTYLWGGPKTAEEPRRRNQRRSSKPSSTRGERALRSDGYSNYGARGYPGGEPQWSAAREFHVLCVPLRHPEVLHLAAVTERLAWSYVRVHRRRWRASLWWLRG